MRLWRTKARKLENKRQGEGEIRLKGERRQREKVVVTVEGRKIPEEN